MGLEVKCTLRAGRALVDGKAHLDSEKLIFRGGERLDLALTKVKSVEVGKGGALVITHDDGVATLGLGDRSTAENGRRKFVRQKA